LCLYNLANNYIQTNEIDLALDTIEKCLLLCDEKEDIYFYAYNIKANCYEIKKEYDKAIDIYNSLLENISDNENPVLGYIYNNLGLNYSHKNNFKDSLKYFEMAEKFKREVDKKTLSHSLIEKSIVFVKQKLYTDAIKTIGIGLKYATEYKDIEYLINGNCILRDIYDKTNDIKNLERIYLALMELLRDNGDKSKLKSIYAKIAFMYLKQGKSTLCEKYLLLLTDLN